MVLDIQNENRISKITNLLGSISDKVLKFIPKKLIEIHDQSGDADNRYKPSKQMRFKISLFNHIYLITVKHILLPKELLVLQIQIMIYMMKNWLLKMMHYLLVA